VTAGESTAGRDDRGDHGRDGAGGRRRKNRIFARDEGFGAGTLQTIALRAGDRDSRIHWSRPPSHLKPAALQLCAVAVCLSVDFFGDAEQPFFAFVGAAGVAVPAFVVGEVVAVRVVRRDF